jgi:putative peptidoglycan binding protein
MKRKRQILTAALLSAGVGLGAQSIFAQSTVPGGGAMGPNNPSQPGPSAPREIQPTIPGQPAPGIPQTDRMPGQPGTIPEQVQRPNAGNQNMAVTSDDIKKAQDALKAKGLSPGTDGNMDAKTQQALRDFQKANNLPVTGVLDDKTADKLGVSKNSDVRSIPERGTSGASSKPTNSLK